MPVDQHMKLALKLAERGRGHTRTNPLVGAVIVKADRVIAEGYHRAYGENHAEVDALERASESVAGAELYVNLEPCTHFGKTPPCVDAIKAAGITRVIAAMIDPNPQVNGAGIRRLREAGVEVVVGVEEEQARQLNEAYLKFVKTGLPFVTLKIAQTFDGKIADNAGNSKWITSEESRRRVHELRAAHDAILVGANTVRTDDPELTAHGQGRDPLRLVVAGDSQFSASTRILNQANRDNTVICRPRGAARQGAIHDGNWEIEGSAERIDLRLLLREAAKRGMASVLVEGGKSIFSQFLAEGLADKIVFVMAPKLLGDGIAGVQFAAQRSIEQTMNFEVRKSYMLGGDLWIEAYPKD